MKKDKWVWMPHAGHFILGDQCKFVLNTYVGDYVVSTIGELWSDQNIRRIHAEVHDSEWYAENRSLKGDYYDHAHMKKFGYGDLGAGERKYETMVFKAKKSSHGCCPWTMKSSEDVDFVGYEKPEDALKGHMAACEIWAAKSR